MPRTGDRISCSNLAADPGNEIKYTQKNQETAPKLDFKYSAKLFLAFNLKHTGRARDF